MKKRWPLIVGIIIALIVVGVVLYIFSNKETPEMNIDNEVVKIDEIDEDLVSDIADCEKTIQNYLDNADKQWEWKEIKNGDNIVVYYVWRLEDGTVFDTNIESIAKACWNYDESKDYTQWLSFEVWSPWLIAWFNEWVIWMKLWQTKTVQFGPEKWYGEYSEDYIFRYTADEIWDLSQFKEGEYIALWHWMVGKITEVTDKAITIDLNNELAGKSLIFDITIKTIN